MSAKPDPAPKSWREVYPPHPAADVFPLLPEEELRELGKDIEENGLRVPIVVWTPADGQEPPFYVLDGRNRLDAMELIGLPTLSDEKPPRRGTHQRQYTPWQFAYEVDCQVVTEDPIPYVISANIMRRHLTPQERVLLVAKALASDPVPTTDRKDLSDRSIQGENGKLQGSTKGHVAKVAEAAQVSKPTARKHLELAVESGELTEDEAGVTPKPKREKTKTMPSHHLNDLVADDAGENVRAQAVMWFEHGLRVKRLLDEGRPITLKSDDDLEDFAFAFKAMIDLANLLARRLYRGNEEDTAGQPGGTGGAS